MMKRAAGRMMPVLSLLTLVVGSTGCAGPTIDVTYDRHTDFSRLRSYRWVEGRHFGVAHRDIAGRSIAEVVVDAVDRDLGSRGYRRVEVGDADFFLRNDLNLDYKQTEQVVNRTGRAGDRDTYDEPPGRRIAPPAREPRVYAEGTVVLEAMNPPDSRSLWRAETGVRLPQHESPEQRLRRIEQVVDRLIRRFPP